MQSIDETIQLIQIGEASGSSSLTGVCSPELAEAPWNFDGGAPSYGPGASMGDIAPAGTPRQGTLPQEYRRCSKEELDLRRESRRMTGEMNSPTISSDAISTQPLVE